MFDDLFEILLEIFVEGTLEGIQSKKIPLPVRVLLGLIFGGLALGLSGVALCRGITQGDLLFCIVMGIVFIFLLLGGWAAFQRRKKRRVKPPVQKERDQV